MHSASELQVVTGSIVQTGAGFGSGREAGASHWVVGGCGVTGACLGASVSVACRGGGGAGVGDGGGGGGRSGDRGGGIQGRGWRRRQLCLALHQEHCIRTG